MPRPKSHSKLEAKLGPGLCFVPSSPRYKDPPRAVLFALETQGLCPLPILRPSQLSTVLTISEKEQQILRMVLEPPAPLQKTPKLPVAAW